jgi:hypothetical protein
MNSKADASISASQYSKNKVSMPQKQVLNSIKETLREQSDFDYSSLDKKDRLTLYKKTTSPHYKDLLKSTNLE